MGWFVADGFRLVKAGCDMGGSFIHHFPTDCDGPNQAICIQFAYNLHTISMALAYQLRHPGVIQPVRCLLEQFNKNSTQLDKKERKKEEKKRRNQTKWRLKGNEFLGPGQEIVN